MKPTQVCDGYAPSGPAMANEIRELFNTHGVRSIHPIKKAPQARQIRFMDDTKAMLIEIHAIPDFHTSHNISELRQYTEDYRTVEVAAPRARTNNTHDTSMDTAADGNLDILITNILPGDTEGVNHEEVIQECKFALAACGNFTDAKVIRRPMAKNIRVLLQCDSKDTKQKALDMAWTLIYRDGCYIVDPTTYSEEKKIQSEAGKVLQIGGYGQLMAAHLTEFMQQTHGTSIVVPPKHVDGKRGTVAYITYKDRETMMAAKETPVYFNGRTNAQYFADKDKIPRPAIERHRPNPHAKSDDDAWIPVMACYKCHSDKHVHKECPEKDTQYKIYLQQIDAILRGSRLPRDKMPALRKFILSAEAREEPVIPQNELAYEKLRDAGITGLKWRITQRQQPTAKTPPSATKPTSANKSVPGHRPVSYAKATNKTQDPDQQQQPKDSSNDKTNISDSNSAAIAKLLERTNQLEQDVKNLTQIISNQQTTIAEQTKQLQLFVEMIKREKDGVGRPNQWIPKTLRPTLRPSEAETILAQRCIAIKAHFLLDYSASARTIMIQIVGRGFMQQLDEWLKKIENISEMTETIAHEAFCALVDDYSFKYGIGEWQKMTDADKDFEYMTEINNSAKSQQ